MTTAPRLYLSRAGKDGEDEPAALEQGLAIIGFRKVPSLEGVASKEDVWRIVGEGFAGESPNAIGNYAGQLNRFVRIMQEGDLVVLPRKRVAQVAIGRVAGPYKYQAVNGADRHTRPIEWLNKEIPRQTFEQDLLNMFGAFMTVCELKKNGAAARILAILKTRKDPGGSISVTIPGPSTGGDGDDSDDASSAQLDLATLAHDQVVRHIQSKFFGHRLADLVAAVLRADGWTTTVSPEGPDGGVDVLAGRGSLGLDSPRLCVQVKSQTSTADVHVLRGLLGTMPTFDADQGLLVCWGGFNSAVTREAKSHHFTVRLWDSYDLVQAVYRTYHALPPEIQADLPLKQAWMLVLEDEEDAS